MLNQIEIFTTKEKITEVRLLFKKESIWLYQIQLAELFYKDIKVILKHIRNIFKEGELDKKVVCANFANTIQHGVV